MRQTLNEMTPSDYTLIFGLGQTGWSCVRYCHAKGMRLKIVDTRLQPPNLIDLKKNLLNNLNTIELFLGPLLEQDFEPILAQVKQIVVSPGVDIQAQAILKIAQARHIPIIGDIELFSRDCKRPYIAITGSNGKTTVTTLVGQLLQAIGLSVGVGGNIGTPALDLLMAPDDYALYVLELSSFQLETTYSLEPRVATILNITPDHLDRYNSYDDYIAAKQRILKNARFIIPEPRLECPPLGHFGVVSQNKKEWLAFNDPIENTLDLLCPVSDLILTGKHDYLNMISALSLVYTMGTSLGLLWSVMKPSLIKVLKNFKGLEHRCQWVACHEGVTWINDSKGTNIGASLTALRSLTSRIAPSKKVILIAGGEGKNQNFEWLRQEMDSMRVSIRQVILIGKDASLIEQVLIKSLPCVRVETLTQAVQLAAIQAHSGDTILLSPCCSSLDQYSSYIERGQDFIRAVTALTGTN